MQGPLWNQIWFWNLIIPPNCFPGKNWILLKWSVFKPTHSSPTRDTKYQRMGAHYEAHPWSTKCYYHHKTSTLWRHWRLFHGLQSRSHSASVWVEPSVKHKVVAEAETVDPKTVAFGLRFKQSTRSALYLNQPQTPNYSLQLKWGLVQKGCA